MVVRVFFFTVLFFSGFGAASAAVGSALPSQGVYSGALTSNDGVLIPLDLSLSYNDDESAGDGDEILLYKKTMRASFVLDQEGGPLSFSTVKYEIETGTLDLRYSRPGIAASSVPTLRFLGKVQPDKSIRGTVTSGLRGDLGTFSVSPRGDFLKLAPHEKYVGHFEGMWTWSNTGKSEEFQLDISANGQTQLNPANLEMDFTPGRAASLHLVESELPLSLSSVVIDYFHSVIWMSMALNGNTIVLEGRLNENSIEGVAHSSLVSSPGKFSVKRVLK